MSNRSDRDDNTRDAEARQENWTPPGVLETPAPPEGYKFRWVRAESAGQDDSKNVTSAQREGYEPVTPEDLPKGYVITVLEHGDKAVVSEGDLILMKIPKKFIDQRNKYYENRTDRTQHAIDSQLMKEGHSDMPMSTAGTGSSFTRGKPRFQEEE